MRFMQQLSRRVVWRGAQKFVFSTSSNYSYAPAPRIAAGQSWVACGVLVRHTTVLRYAYYLCRKVVRLS